CQNYLTAPLTF
nr:immunoglobulin light chain junction region [Macaca mulatta]MOV34282.1 immunoglobulin light chain junction region [Macaca mulatta]